MTKDLIVLSAIALLALLTGIGVVTLVAGKADVHLIAAILGALTVEVILITRFIHNGGSDADSLLFSIALFLTVLGLVFVFRLKPNLFIFQALWTAISLAAFAVSVKLARRIDTLANYKYIIGFIGIVLLMATIVFGVEIGGNKNWLILGPIRFQPSEFAKLFIIVFLASYLTERREVLAFATRSYGLFKIPEIRFVAPLAVLWGLTMLMLVFQRDLGSALLYFGTALLMIYIASGRVALLMYGATFFAAGSVLCYLLFPHVQTRLDIWINPWQDPSGRAYQIVQSLFAFGSGGVFGTGLGRGFPDIIPEVHTDFVYAAIAEELGLLGAGGIILLYMILFYRAFRTAFNATCPFRQMIASGLAVFISLQTLLIIGGVTKFLPLTGVTLPFISYGGSSLVANYILIGTLFAISEARKNDEE